MRGKRFLLAVGSANPTKNWPRGSTRSPAAGGPSRNRDRRGDTTGSWPADGRTTTRPACCVPARRRCAAEALYRHATAFVFPSLRGFGLPRWRQWPRVPGAVRAPPPCSRYEHRRTLFRPALPRSLTPRLRRLLDDEALSVPAPGRPRTRPSSRGRIGREHAGRLMEPDAGLRVLRSARSIRRDGRIESVAWERTKGCNGRLPWRRAVARNRRPGRSASAHLRATTCCA